MSTPISTQERNQIKLQGFLEDKLKWHDYTHIAVDDDSLAPADWFVHTVGRARSGKPELIVTGQIDSRRAMDLISDVVAYEARGGVLRDGERLTPDQARISLVLKDVSTPFVRDKRVVQATSRFGSGIRVIQVVWPDGAGRFPDEPGYDAAGCPQQALWRAG
ncbi:MAG TPA: DUF4262 domain-containing protein [Castellaniella sp.]|uniref:DUF4262 domain-containing protein n=1 Tax=Castellaniella sp. TaxID=1955812 RepID=UPI002F1AF1C9